MSGLGHAGLSAELAGGLEGRARQTDHTPGSTQAAPPSDGENGARAAGAAAMEAATGGPIGKPPTNLFDVQWTAQEQSVLEEGIKKYTTEQYTSLWRYIKIAAHLPSKGVRDVALRVRWMTRKEGGRSKRKAGDLDNRGASAGADGHGGGRKKGAKNANGGVQHAHHHHHQQQQQQRRRRQQQQQSVYITGPSIQRGMMGEASQAQRMYAGQHQHQHPGHHGMGAFPDRRQSPQNAGVTHDPHGHMMQRHMSQHHLGAGQSHMVQMGSGYGNHIGASLHRGQAQHHGGHPQMDDRGCMGVGEGGVGMFGMGAHPSGPGVLMNGRMHPQQGAMHGGGGMATHGEVMMGGPDRSGLAMTPVTPHLMCHAIMPVLEDHGGPDIMQGPGGLPTDIRDLLNGNKDLIDTIVGNMENSKLADNIDLLSQLRDNILIITEKMNTTPGLMSQMPQLPLQMDANLANAILPPQQISSMPALQRHASKTGEAGMARGNGRQ